MKRLSSIVCRAVPLLAALLLAGCAGNREPGHDGRRYEAMPGPMHGQSSGGGMMGQGQPGAMGPMNTDEMQAMCDRHRQMLDARTPEERRALMNDNMRNMPPEELERQMDRIRAQCG